MLVGLTAATVAIARRRRSPPNEPDPFLARQGRVTLVLLAVVPVALAYPWQSTRDYVLLGVAAAVVIGLFGFWRGLYFTTIARRGLAILRRRRRIAEPATCTRTTVLVWVGPPASDTNVLPLTLIARYLDRYGIRADTIRITSRVTASGDCRTWVGLTVVADDNLAALQARSARIPCRDRAGRGAPARRPSARNRLGGWYGRTRRDPSVGGCGFSRDVARNAAHRLGLRCGISGQRQCRVARYVARDPVASGAGDLDRAGDRICRRVINPLHGGRCLRIADRLAAWRHRTGGRPAPATRKPRASPDSLGSAIHPPTRRAHRCSCRPADPAALAYSYRRRPPGTADQRRQSNMRPCRNTVIRRR